MCSQRCSAQHRSSWVERDARLFIDLCAQALEYSGRYLSEELGKQVETALGQLRLAQVSAENEGAKGRARAQRFESDPEATDCWEPSRS